MACTPNLDDFLALVSSGLSVEQATKVAHVSKRTVWLRRRSSPEFAAALHFATQTSLAIRAAERDEHFRERYYALALEAADKDWLRSGRFSRRMKKVWYRWKGEWPSDLPGCSPSHRLDRPGTGHLDHYLRANVRDKMLADFAKRSEEKPGRRLVPTPKPETAPKSRPAPAPTSNIAPIRGRARARVLW